MLVLEIITHIPRIPMRNASPSSLLFPSARIFCRAQRTDGGRLDHVADGESLDRLVLGGASRAVGATDRLDVAPAVLVAAAVKQLLVKSPVVVVPGGVHS